jgi:uncharacterized coiled-coil DUF342 family protein
LKNLDFLFGWPYLRPRDKEEIIMSEKRDAYVEKLKAKLDDWNAKIDKLEARAQQASVDSKAELQKQIANVKARRDEVVAKIDSLRQAGDGAWKDLKGGVKSSWRALDKAFRSAASNFSKAKAP